MWKDRTRMSTTKPLTWQKRRSNYKAQTGSKTLTPAQRRRDSQKRSAKKNGR